jgi:hypothetical protein
MHVDAVAVSHSSHSFHTSNSTNESRKPMLPRDVRNVSPRNDGWSTSTKVALGVTGAVIGLGTVITALGSGNPVASAVVAGGLFSGIAKPFFSHVEARETLPVPGQQVGALVPPTNPIDTCNLLVADASTLNGQRIGDISLSALQSLKSGVEEACATDLNALTPSQLNEMGRCFGRNLMSTGISSLKGRLENAERSIMAGRTDDLAGQVSDNLFHSVLVIRQRLLLAEVEPRLKAVNEVHAKLRSFVLAINDRILSNVG